MAKTIESTKKSFERLIYWESFTYFLAVTYGLFTAWLMGWFGLGFGWLILLGIAVGSTLSRASRRLKGTIHEFTYFSI
jgi:hypothetical protein